MNSFAETVCAGIVTYNPEPIRFKAVVSAIVSQVKEVFIEDNGSENIDGIISIAGTYPNVQVHTLEENKGIAYALNRLCDSAISGGYEWILTLDHDTICSEGMIDSFSDLASVQEAGIICPRIHYVGIEVPEHGNTNDRYSEVTACMTSGSLMRIEAFKKTPGFDDWMFIDYVDNDICMKLNLAGYKIIRDNKVFMDHQLGHVVKRRVFGIMRNDFQYSPVRIYYIMRNTIYFKRKYRKHISRIKYELIVLLNIHDFWILYMHDKDRMDAMKRGIKDGKKAEADPV